MNGPFPFWEAAFVFCSCKNSVPQISYINFWGKKRGIFCPKFLYNENGEQFCPKSQRYSTFYLGAQKIQTNR